MALDISNTSSLRAGNGAPPLGEDDGGRGELLRGARAASISTSAASAAPPGMRTADEIRAAYGRPSSSRQR